MKLKPLSLKTIIEIGEIWKTLGGCPEVEIGALEPLLWKDGNYKINDVVRALSDLNYKVSMTTNAQLLYNFVKPLKDAGLSLLRTSWHTTDPVMFRELSGGYGDYTKFFEGTMYALESGLKISFNRVLLRGYNGDISDQLDLIEKYSSRLKLYTLMWTPENNTHYADFYQDWQSVVENEILKRSSNVKSLQKGAGRSRLQFFLKKGGLVEVKISDSIDRTHHPCNQCLYKDKCEEAFGDYVRIDPQRFLYFCYMRRDLGFTLDFKDPAKIIQKIGETFFAADIPLDKVPLRLTVTPFCNFNCRIPGEEKGWCMEQPGGYSYPKIKKSILIK